MLLEYLKENYKTNEPIFMVDINLPVSDTNLRQMFKVLCDKGQIDRYDKGIYYLKSKTRLKGVSSLSARQVAKYKYISNKDSIKGYYSGYTFANQLGLTMQVPYVLEIVTNNTSAKYRKVEIKDRSFILRKPYVKINNDNYYILQLLDLLKDFDKYVDEDIQYTSKRLIEYIKEKNIKQNEVDKYIGLYPDRIYKVIYEMRLYNVFA